MMSSLFLMQVSIKPLYFLLSFVLLGLLYWQRSVVFYFCQLIFMEHDVKLLL